MTERVSTGNGQRVLNDEDFHVFFITKPSVQKALGDEPDIGLLRFGAGYSQHLVDEQTESFHFSDFAHLDGSVAPVFSFHATGRGFGRHDGPAPDALRDEYLARLRCRRVSDSSRTKLASPIPDSIICLSNRCWI